jgi:hypothetical protein
MKEQKNNQYLRSPQLNARKNQGSEVYKAPEQNTTTDPKGRRNQKEQVLGESPKRRGHDSHCITGFREEAWYWRGSKAWPRRDSRAREKPCGKIWTVDTASPE